MIHDLNVFVDCMIGLLSFRTLFKNLTQLKVYKVTVD